MTQIKKVLPRSAWESDEITDEQKANRKILRDTMEKEDFVWYPGE